MITVHKADQLKRFAPFLYLSHSFILSVNVKVCITFIVLLQISLCFFLCQESYWMRGVCIRLGGGLAIWGVLLLGVSVPHYMPCYIIKSNIVR